MFRSGSYGGGIKDFAPPPKAAFSLVPCGSELWVERLVYTVIACERVHLAGSWVLVRAPLSAGYPLGAGMQQ